MSIGNRFQFSVTPAGATYFKIAVPTTATTGTPCTVTVTALDGGIISVPVLLDNPHPEGSTGMTEAILGLTYDPKVLTVSADDITLGTIAALGTGWHLESVIDQATGQIAIDLYSTSPIMAAEAGSLVYINFHIVPGAAVPMTAVRLVSAVTPEGRWLSTEVADNNGPFVLSSSVDQVLVEPGFHGVRSLARGGGARDPGSCRRKLAAAKTALSQVPGNMVH